MFKLTLNENSPYFSCCCILTWCIGLHIHRPKEICFSEIYIMKYYQICNAAERKNNAAHVGLSSSPHRPQQRLKDK